MSGWMQEQKEGKAEVKSREWHARHEISAMILILLHTAEGQISFMDRRTPSMGGCVCPWMAVSTNTSANSITACCKAQYLGLSSRGSLAKIS